MSVADWMIILAILLAPLLAVQAQKYLDLLREKHQRKLNVFHTLMATRAAKISAAHVQALNMIDIEFYGTKIFKLRYQKKSEKAVVEAWKVYHDHLHTEYSKEEFNSWARKADDLLSDLLHKMAQALGYEFDKVQLTKGIYSPKGHGEQEIAQLIIRDNLVRILSGEKALPMEVVSLPVSENALQKQDAIQTGLLEYLEGKRVVKVKIENEENK